MIHPFNSQESLGSAMTVFGRSVKGTFISPSMLNMTQTVQTRVLSQTQIGLSPPTEESYTLYH